MMKNTDRADEARQKAEELGSNIAFAAMSTYTTQKQAEQFWTDYVDAIETTGNVGEKSRTREHSEEIARRNIKLEIGKFRDDLQEMWRSVIGVDARSTDVSSGVL